MDDLSNNLLQLNIGCYMENNCTKHLFYADDCVLIAPSPHALQALVHVCEIYCIGNELLYNGKKSVCMAFLPTCLKKRNLPSIFLNGAVMDCMGSRVKYLGFYFTEDLYDSRDIQRQIRFIYAKGNTLVRKFNMCSTEIKLQLFKSYCYNLYCCHLWSSYPQSKFNNIKVAYNNVFRHLLNIKGYCSISQLFMYNHVNSFHTLVRNSICRLFNSQNVLLRISSAFFKQSKCFKSWSRQIFI